MKRALLIALMLVAVTSCSGGSSQRTVLVDYKHDEFASAFFDFFPNRVQAHPGDTVVFHQAWSGEPHSVTMGTYVDEYGKLLKPYLKIFAKKGYAGLPDDTPKNIKPIEDRLPWMTDDNGNVSQNGAQPCFIKNGLPPKDMKKTCTSAEHVQPAFDGTYKFYNSGFIPYDGENGDTYTVKLANDIKPGEHFFYCNYHGPFMSGFLDVKPASQKLPSPGDVAKLANVQIAKAAAPLVRDFHELQNRNYALSKHDLEQIKRFENVLTRRENGKTYFNGWLAGFGSDNVDTAQIDEFIPSRITAKVGQKLRWLVLGSHTISFNVPKYFPIIQTSKSGKISLNPKIKPPFGGAPDESDYGEEQHQGATGVDAPAWDGRGFWSTGLLESYDNPIVYTMRITRPGTYKFACLIHPPMVGTLVVS